MSALVDVWLCSEVEAVHCESCHQDADHGYALLPQYEFGCVLIHACCQVVRDLHLYEETYGY